MALAAGLCAFVAFHDIARHATAQLGLLCLAAGLVCCIGQLRLAASLYLVVAALALMPVIPAYLPRFSHAVSGCRLTVVTFNHLELGQPDDVGAARLLSRLDPDIILAQKVIDTAAFQQALFADGFSGFSTYLSPDNKEVILSRFPITATIDKRDNAAADILVSGDTVRLMGLYADRPVGEHATPGGNPELYREYYAHLNDDIRSYSGPLILAGDGNATIFTPEISGLRHLLRDAWDEAGYGLGATFPGPRRWLGFFGPFIRIDYIFHNDAFAAVDARRINEVMGAGHYPVWAELVFLNHGEAGKPCR